MSFEIRSSSIEKEGELHLSRWLDLGFLVSLEEMKSLLNELSPFFIFSINGVLSNSSGLVEKKTFLEYYAKYLETIKKNIPHDSQSIRKYFYTSWTKQYNHLYKIQISSEKSLIKSTKPLLQLKPLALSFSPLDEEIRSAPLNNDTIDFGIEISYPQICQNSKTKVTEHIINHIDYPNSDIFKTLRKWLRHNTRPSFFLYNEKKITSSFRIGKECFSWINQHPKLVQHKLSIQTISLKRS